MDISLFKPSEIFLLVPFFSGAGTAFSLPIGPPSLTTGVHYSGGGRMEKEPYVLQTKRRTRNWE